MKHFLLGTLATLIAILLLALVVASSGIVSVSARTEEGALEHLLGYVSRRSIARHAGERTNPVLDDRTARAVALLHYKENCLLCHGAPGLEGSEFARGLNPPPPSLTGENTRSLSDGELFWIVSNGIRMTGMPAFSPTHDEDELWKIVNLVRHLGELTETEKAQLAAGRVDEAEHHHDDAAKSEPPPEARPEEPRHEPTEHEQAAQGDAHPHGGQ